VSRAGFVALMIACLAGCSEETRATAGTDAAPEGGGSLVIQYDCIPNYANWGGVTEAYLSATGVRVPPDMKGSSAAMAALEAEQANPRADTAYYSGAIGYQAAQKGLHQPYRPAGWERIPAELKDPEGLWWTVHVAHIALLVNTEALGGKPVPRTFQDLLDPQYAGMVVYDDPRIHGTAYTFVYGINQVLGGGSDLNAGFEYLKKLDANILRYAKENSYNELVRGEIPIWINADGNGLKARHADGAPIEVVIPEEGTITMPLIMGMVRGAPHPVETRKYLDWLLGDDAQRLFAEAFFRPVMDVALSEDLAAKLPPRSAYAKAVVPPLSEMAAAADAVKQRWEREVAGQ
jgi:putative spermidine/putrescine transport system substrate-binding protein